MSAASTPQQPEPEFEGYGYPFSFFDTEHLDNYRPGGLHPIIYGDTLGPDGRFVVVHKLGNGGYGTVWLCRDTARQTWKAVKVMMASVSDDKSTPLGDLLVMDRCKGVSREELWDNSICLPEEHFWQTGPNGRHLCLVLPVLGETVASAWDDFAGGQPELLKQMCAQMCSAMLFLHNRGLCHGDFRPQNILYGFGSLDGMSEEEVMGMITESEGIEVGPIPGTDEGPGPHLPAFIYEATPLTFPPKLYTSEIMVVDFGEAYAVSNPPADNGIPLSFAAPEGVLQTQPIGFPADVWSLAVCLCSIRQGRVPFDDGGIIGYVRRIEDVLGPLPEPYRSSWFAKGYGQQCNSLGPDLPPPNAAVSVPSEYLEELRKERLEASGYGDFLERLVRDKTRFAMMAGPGDLVWQEYQTPKEEADVLLDLIKSVFKYQPAERPSVADIIRHPWFDDAFLPDPVEEQGGQDEQQVKDGDSQHRDPTLPQFKPGSAPDHPQCSSPLSQLGSTAEDLGERKSSQGVRTTPTEEAETRQHTDDSSTATVEPPVAPVGEVQDLGPEQQVAERSFMDRLAHALGRVFARAGLVHLPCVGSRAGTRG